MLYPMMLMGIGFLTACLLMAMLAPLIHERAVRLTVRRLSAKRPRSAIDRRAHEDQLRAHFAVSIRRLETAVEDAQAKAAGQLCDAARKSAEIDALKSELRKRNIVILRFQARELMRRSMTRTIIKVIIFLYARSMRQSEQTQQAPVLRRREVRRSELGAVSA
jgi:ribosomal protein S20